MVEPLKKIASHRQPKGVPVAAQQYRPVHLTNVNLRYVDKPNEAGNAIR